MSFILEALKKSEQQRQQKNTSPPKVRKRTLATPPLRQGRSPYWFVAIALSLVLLCSWWFFDKPEPVLEQSHAVSQSKESSASRSQAAAVEPVVMPTPVVSVPQSSVAVVEPVPVSRDVVSTPPVPVNTTMKNNTPVAQSKRTEVSTAEGVPTSDERIATVIVKQPKPRAIGQPSLKSTPVKLPLYLDLSRSLREQMPRLAMSMHYYITDPARRMVRINNLLLHEGDWVSDDLQVVAISRTGVTLDFLGKLFEMRSASR
ncbi:MAG: general secretion pathway protein GspB [Desulfuromonadales bacterium]|nr:general secretion pathway protein GspB [Desulfuromonadales bacterium]